MNDRRGPLSGVRIVDFTANMAGPFATQILGDQGADVVKIEPPDGDPMRNLGNGHAGYSAFYANLNRSKRGITLDLGHPEAHRIVQPLLDGADVVVQASRPEPARRFGLDAPQVMAGRPRVIHATISGFGSVGPYAGRPAYDHVIQAMSGFAAAQANATTGEPELVRQGIVDKLVGNTAAQAITAALFERSQTGVGRAIEVRMLDSALAFLWPDAMMNDTVIEPEVRRASITRSFRLTPTSDGHVAFALVTARQVQRLAEAVGLDPVAPSGGIMNATRQRLAELTTNEAVELLARFDVAVAPVLSLDQLYAHPQAIAANAVDEWEHPVLGTVRQANPAVRWGDERVTNLRAAPSLGADTREVCAELGLDDVEVDRLRAAGVFGSQFS